MSASLGRVVVLDENLSVPFDRRVWHEARSLSRAGFEVDVVCPQGTERDREPFELREGIRIHRFPAASANGSAISYVREYGSALWHMSRLIRKLARERPFDLVHACNPPDLLLLVAWPLKRRGARFLLQLVVINDQGNLCCFSRYSQRQQNPRFWSGRYRPRDSSDPAYRLDE